MFYLPGLKTLLNKKPHLGEICLVCGLIAFIIGLSQIETKFFFLLPSAPENRKFFATLAYFAFINLNIFLILTLGFLIFRQITHLIIEHKNGILGAKLSSKLVVALVFFALAPTIMICYVSTQFIATKIGRAHV